MNEDSFINFLTERFDAEMPEGCLGIGDDCAVIPAKGEDVYLLTTDSLQEGVHFIKSKTKPFELGGKLLQVNLSDVCAMGGKGNYALFSVGLPKGVDEDWLRSLVEGLRDSCQWYDIQLLGGNTTRSEGGIVLSLTLIGECKRKHVKLRSGAKKGDIIAMTDCVGMSGVGCRLLLEGNKIAKGTAEACVDKYSLPWGYRGMGGYYGEWMGKQEAVTSMIDISDGFDTDLKRVLHASQCGAKVYADKFMLPGYQDLVVQMGWGTPWKLAVTSGEEYTLLFTVDQEKWSDFRKNFYKEFRHQPIACGEITDESGTLRYFQADEEVELDIEGFSHF